MSSVLPPVNAYFVSLLPLKANDASPQEILTCDVVYKKAVEILSSQLVLIIEATKLSVYSFYNPTQTARYSVNNPLFIEKITEQASENGLFVTEKKVEENEYKEIELRTDDEKGVVILEAIKSPSIDFVKAGSTTVTKSTEERAIISAAFVATTSSSLQIAWKPALKKYCFTDMQGNIFQLTDLKLLDRIKNLVCQNLSDNKLFRAEQYCNVNGKRGVTVATIKILYTKK